jgi:hypothetical protein
MVEFGYFDEDEEVDKAEEVPMPNVKHDTKGTHEIYSLFPLPVYKTNIRREFTIQETDEFDALISTGLAERNLNSFKDISKDKYLLNGSRKPLLAIQSFIEQHLKEYCFTSAILGIDENKISCYITQAWLNVYKTESFNPVHSHKNSIVSGVLYLNCLNDLPDDTTDGINFFNFGRQMFGNIELPIKAPSTFGTSYGSSEFSGSAFRLQVVTGDLVLFPSSLKHSVNINQTTNQKRVSLSFNTFVSGELGYYGEANELVLK